MSQDALAARKEEAQEALEAVKRERDLLLDIFGRPTDQQKGDALVRKAGEGDGPAVARLVADGANPNAVGSAALEENHLDGITPLVAAIYGDKDGIIEQLLAADADYENEDRNMARPLMWAARYSRPACLRRLLAAGALVGARDRFGMTALHYVTNAGERSPGCDLCARLLLDEGADKNARDARGRTPLMHAVDKNVPSVVAMLLNEGADRAMADNDGRTALQLADANGYNEVAALLRGTDPSLQLDGSMAVKSQDSACQGWNIFGDKK